MNNHCTVVLSLGDSPCFFYSNFRATAQLSGCWWAEPHQAAFHDVQRGAEIREENPVGYRRGRSAWATLVSQRVNSFHENLCRSVKNGETSQLIFSEFGWIF